MTIAKDIMSTAVAAVKPGSSIVEAIDILLDRKISGLPVVDDNDRVVGVVTVKDLIKVLASEGMGDNRTVEHFMSKEVVSFKEDDPAIIICDAFIKKTFRRVPIVNAEDKLVGIISRRAVLRLIFNTLMHSPE